MLLSRRVRSQLARARRNPAVVIGTNVTGLAEARTLAAFGVPVIGVDQRSRPPTSFSGAFAGLVITEAFESPELIGVLERLAEEIERPIALFISTDEQVKLVADHGPGLARRYRFDFPARDTVHTLMSKEAFSVLAQERGWPIPRTVWAASLDELRQRLEQVRWPVILKPRVKNLAFRSHASQKAYRCADWDALARAYADVEPWEPEVVVQEWISGADADVHFSFHYHTSEMAELCHFFGRKIRQWIPEVGSTAASRPADAPPGLVSLSRDILQAVECRGFGSVEYKRDARTGRFLITEPTVGRVNLQVGTAIANGADLVVAAYCHVMGLAQPATAPPRRPVVWVYGKNDWRSFRYYRARGELTWGEYWRSLRGPRTYAVWTAKDPMMLLRTVFDTARRVPRAILRRVRRLASMIS